MTLKGSIFELIFISFFFSSLLAIDLNKKKRVSLSSLILQKRNIDKHWYDKITTIPTKIKFLKLFK